MGKDYVGRDRGATELGSPSRHARAYDSVSVVARDSQKCCRCGLSHEFGGQLETGVDDRLNVCMVLRSDIRDSLFLGIDTKGRWLWFIARTFKREQVVWTGKCPCDVD